jgi:hypothetical protein
MTRLSATFASPADAALARATLVQAGVSLEHLVLSVGLTDDGIGAEAPGQSYENQSDRSSDQVEVGPGYTDTDRARYNQELRTAACVLTVSLASASQQEAICGILRKHGAKSVISAPG